MRKTVSKLESQSVRVEPPKKKQLLHVPDGVVRTFGHEGCLVALLEELAGFETGLDESSPWQQVWATEKRRFRD